MRGRVIAGAARVLAVLPLLLGLWLGSAGAAELSFPALTGRVVDDAGVLAPATRSRLDAMLARDQQASGRQIVVVTLKSLQGDAIEDFGYRLGRAWGIGQKGKDTGALLIVVPSEHKVRIEVGYGLEGSLTDAASRAIIEQDILPAFRRGDIDAGVLAGTTAILRTLGSTAVAAAPRPAPPHAGGSSSNGLVLAVILILVWFVGGRYLWPLFLVGALQSGRGGFGMGGLGMGGLGLGGGMSGRSSSDLGGGGFSGGGGSFGGGGASGSW